MGFARVISDGVYYAVIFNSYAVIFKSKYWKAEQELSFFGRSQTYLVGSGSGSYLKNVFSQKRWQFEV